MGGLVRGIARTAVVAGTAQASRNAVNRHAAKKNMEAYSEAASEVQAEHAGAAPPPSQDDTIAQLERLGALHSQGVLTDEEFAAQKAKVLGT